jgi:hypothetical protein
LLAHPLWLRLSVCGAGQRRQAGELLYPANLLCHSQQHHVWSIRN